MAETTWPPFRRRHFQTHFHWMNECYGNFDYCEISSEVCSWYPGPINNIPALVQIMAWRQLGDKPLSEPMMVLLLTHICVTRPQWVKCLNAYKPHLRTTQRWPQMVNSVQISGGGNQLTYPCVLVALMQRYNSLTYDKTLWKFFTTHYKLQITRFQMTKFVWNAFNINPKRIICQIACSILSQE